MTGLTLWDVLSFKQMIAPNLLIPLYYLGALVIPMIVWLILRMVEWRVFPVPDQDTHQGEQSQSMVSLNYRLVFWGIFVAMLVAAELTWRIFFEFMIAYFQIHNALLH